MSESRPSGSSADDIRVEIGRLRAEVERLAAELDDIRTHAASLEALAHEDSLTGLLNRRGFLRDLARAIAFRGRYATPAALLITDLDRFKPINDRYGHEVGDRALVHIASLLRRHVRASDSIGRLGGDEFALVIWHVDRAAAEQKARALEAIVASSPFEAAGTVLRLGMSIGATLLEPGDAPEDAIARADQAMYARKTAREALRR